MSFDSSKLESVDQKIPSSLLPFMPALLTTAPVPRKVSDEVNWESEDFPTVPQRCQCVESG